MTTEERIYRELLNEHASVWFISDEVGAKVIAKITSPLIKSIIKGCKIEFLFGKDCTQKHPVFHTGLRIYGDPVHYAAVIGPELFADGHKSISAIMNRSFTYMHFHNELGFCVATAKLSFCIADQLRILNLQGNTDRLYCGKFNESVSRSLDCFDHSIKWIVI